MRSRSIVILSALTFSLAHAYTLPEHPEVLAYDCEQCEFLPREALSTAWTLSSNKPLEHETRHQQISRKYKIKTTMKQLQAGVSVYTQGPEAVIRITPLSSNSIKNPAFKIKGKSGQALSLMDASSLFAKDEALAQNNLGAMGQQLLQLKPELGKGQFIITADPGLMKFADEDAPYLIQVFDKNSTAYLSIATDKSHYYQGDELTVNITLTEDDYYYPVDEIEAALVNSLGEVIPISVQHMDKNVYQAKTTLNSNQNSLGVNWYVTTDVTSIIDYEVIKRHAHTAISYSIPSAAIREIHRKGTNTLEFSAHVDVATNSRYALQAVLFGTNNQGKIEPIQTAQSSALLTAGERKINFSFDANEVQGNYKAPFYLGYLRLTDYGQFKPVFAFDKPINLSEIID